MKQNGISFNNVKTAGIEKEVWPLILADQQGPDSEGGIINAVDIDWNDTEIDTSNIYSGSSYIGHINTTGDVINNINQKVYIKDFVDILRQCMAKNERYMPINYYNNKININGYSGYYSYCYNIDPNDINIEWKYIENYEDITDRNLKVPNEYHDNDFIYIILDKCFTYGHTVIFSVEGNIFNILLNNYSIYDYNPDKSYLVYKIRIGDVCDEEVFETIKDKYIKIQFR